MKTFKIILVTVFVSILVSTIIYMIGPIQAKAEPNPAVPAFTFSVTEANALIASGLATSSSDLYPDAIYQDCYVYFQYNGMLFAPEVESIFNPSTNTFTIETRCYNSVRLK